MPNKHSVKELIFLSRYWTMSEAMWVLWVCNSDANLLWWKKFWASASTVAVATDGASMAHEVPVRFQGGPGKIKMFGGSFAMFAVDRVLRLTFHTGGEIGWLLRFNPGSSRHIADQLESQRPQGEGYRNKRQFFGDERDGHHEHDDLLSHYEGAEKVTDYVQVGDSIIPILESGRQGAAISMETGATATDGPVTIYDDGRVARWSSSGKVNV
jgi:hypothetical protein